MTNLNQIVSYEANGELVEISKDDVKAYLVSGNPKAVTDQEVTMYLQLCRFQGLNPWLKEAYLIKYSEKAPAQLVVGKEAYMKRAQAQPDFSHFEAGLIVQRGDDLLEVEGSFKTPKDVLLGGWAKVYRKGIEQPTVAKVSIAEYSQGQSTWNQKPATMIRKVAIVQALRETYPEQLGAMYTEEEGRQVHLEEIDEELDPEKKSARKDKKTARKQLLPNMKKENEVVEADYEVVEEEADVEAENGMSKKASKEELEILYESFEVAGISSDEASAMIKDKYKKSTSKDLTFDEVQEMILWATDKASDAAASQVI